MSEIIRMTSSEDPRFQSFVDLPRWLYPPQSARFAVPETIPTDHLAAHYLLLTDGKPTARASLYHNPDLVYEGQPAWTIGNYESAADTSAAVGLLGHVTGEAAAAGARYLLGPMNGSTWENYRFGTDHVNPPFFLEPFHHPYYNDQFTAAGFKSIADYYTNVDTALTFDRPEIVAREKELKAEGVVIRSIDLAHYEDELEKIHEFNRLAFKNNFLYTPVSRQRFVGKYLAARALIDPNFTLIAEDRDQRLIGYYFCIDDLLNRHEKALIVKTLVRHPAPQWRGLGHVMGNVVYRNAHRLGYGRILHSFIYQHGTSTKLSDNFSGVRYRNYALYGKKIA